MISIGTMGTISEDRSRQLVEAAGIPVSPWGVADDPEEALGIARELGYPVAVKLNGDTVTHKTEGGLIRLDLHSAQQVKGAASELMTLGGDDTNLLVTQMVVGHREIIAGVVRDEEFGPCVMLGLGGVLAEALDEVAFRLAPLDVVDVEDLLDDFHAQALFGQIRGEPPLDREATVNLLIALGSMATNPEVLAVDLNPLIISDGQLIAVDALVELADGGS